MAAWMTAGDMQSLHGAANHKGIKLASAITASVQVPIVNPGDTIIERMKSAIANTIAPLEDPTMMRIDAGDFVFMQRETPANMFEIDRNPFSVFNGLDDMTSTKLTLGIVEFNKRFMFVGVAMDDVPFVQGPLSVDKIDLQISGVCSWVNGSAETANPGDLVVCIPDSSTMRSAIKVTGTPGWVPAATSSHVVKARCIPCKSAGIYGDVVPKKDIDQVKQDIKENIRKVATDDAKLEQQIEDAIQKLESAAYSDIKVSSLVIGKNYSVVMPGAIGQLALLL
jgi:hypothetical protein